MEIPKEEETPQESTTWIERLRGQYQQTRQHAETYPYVWGSYILVYGGVGLWLAYRYRRLRMTEGRVKVLQERLRKLVEHDEASKAAVVAEQMPNSASNTTKLESSDTTNVTKSFVAAKLSESSDKAIK